MAYFESESVAQFAPEWVAYFGAEWVAQFGPEYATESLRKTWGTITKSRLCTWPYSQMKSHWKAR